MIKKNLRRTSVVITKQTYWNLCLWAAAAGWGETDRGRISDKLVRERAISESTSRRFEEERQDAWRFWPQEKPEEDGEYIVQIEGAIQATALWYRKEGQEWHDLYEEQEVYRIVKWQPLPEV